MQQLLPRINVPGVHIYPMGHRVRTPGKQFTYTVIGPVCRLYDRDELPYPICSLQWKGKAPSWNRIGKRLIPDVACKRNPSYSVILDYEGAQFEKVITLYWVPLSDTERQWWVTPSCKLQHYL